MIELLKNRIVQHQDFLQVELNYLEEDIKHIVKSRNQANTALKILLEQTKSKQIEMSQISTNKESSIEDKEIVSAFSNQPI